MFFNKLCSKCGSWGGLVLQTSITSDANTVIKTGIVCMNIHKAIYQLLKLLRNLIYPICCSAAFVIPLLCLRDWLFFIQVDRVLAGTPYSFAVSAFDLMFLSTSSNRNTWMFPLRHDESYMISCKLLKFGVETSGYRLLGTATWCWLLLLWRWANWELFNTVAPQFTIKVRFWGEKNLPSCLVGLKTPSTIMSQPGSEPPVSRTARTMGTEVPCSYPLVHRGIWSVLGMCRDLSGEVGLWCLVGMLISLWSMLLGGGLEVCSLWPLSILHASGRQIMYRVEHLLTVPA